MQRAQRTAGRLLALAAVALLVGAAAGCSKHRHAVGPDEGRFVASRLGAAYHTRECNVGMRIKRRNLLYYRTGGDAYRDGFMPCRTCHPERKEESKPSSGESEGKPSS
jgi:hypothetical protein